jgi:predicted acetyltransferase
MGERLAGRIEVRRASTAEKVVVRHLMQLYNHDFAEFDGNDVGEDGLYAHAYDLDRYWTGTTRHPFLVRVDGKLAGFALMEIEQKDDGSPYCFLAEFFIMKKYRGQGVGQAVAFALFDRYPGEWQVSQIERNLPAQVFWRKVIGRYTGGHFNENILEDGEVLQTFISPRA